MATSTWSSNHARSWRTTYGGWRTDNNFVYQGQWQSFGLHRGLWFFNDSSIRNTLSGRTITGVRIYVTRRSEGGASASGTASFRTHNHSSQPSGQPTVSTQVASSGFAWGTGKWVTLPVSVGNALRDGSARGIALYSQSSSPYMIFNAAAVLEITHEPTVVPPATPTGLTVTGTTVNSVSLRWNNVSNADNYRVDRSGAGTQLSTNRTHTWSGLAAGTSYSFRVRAQNSAGNSSYSSWVSGTTNPTTPTGLQVTSRTASTINLSWNSNGHLVTNYRVHNQTTGQTHTTSGTTLALSLPETGTYQFRIRAENAGGNSSYSSSITTLGKTQNVILRAASSTGITLAWDNVSGASYGYDVERDGVLVSDPDTVSFADSGLSPDTSYDYRVRARPSGIWSDVITVSTREADALEGIKHAAAQLTDNSTVYVEKSGSDYLLKRITEDETITTIDTIPTNILETQALRMDHAGHRIAMTSDADDNIYLVGARGNSNDHTTTMAYVKTGASTWSRQGVRSLLGNNLMQNPVAHDVVWFDSNNGNNGKGRLFIVWRHGMTGGHHFAIVDANEVLESNPVTVRSSGAAGFLVSSASYRNATDKNLSIASDVFGGNRIGFICHATAGSDARTRYGVLTAGTNISNVVTSINTNEINVEASDAKVIGMDNDFFTFIWTRVSNLAIRVYSSGSLTQNASFSSGGYTDLIHEQDTVYVYHWDGTNLERVSFNPATGVFGSPITRDTDSGTPRQLRCVNRLRNRSYIEVHWDRAGFRRFRDFANQPPTAPTLTPKGTFNATSAETFSWTFNDPNISDTQGAYEMEIRRVSDNSVAFSTGKVSNSSSSQVVSGATLTNGVLYRWRVRTWDSFDAMSPWSPDQEFSPTASATIEVTAPTAGQVETRAITAEWSYSHPASDPQTEYRVRILNVLDGESETYSSGWVSSAATSYTTENILVDSVYRVEVQVKTSGVESNVDSVIINRVAYIPNQPSVTATGYSNYILVELTNATPTGDRPAAQLNVIYRRSTPQEGWLIVGRTGNDGSFKDYAVSSGTPYSYYAEAQ